MMGKGFEVSASFWVSNVSKGLNRPGHEGARRKFRRRHAAEGWFLRHQIFRYNLTQFLPAKQSAPLAQLDRASGYEPEGREFESLRAHHSSIT
jgi:hypothetical protein